MKPIHLLSLAIIVALSVLFVAAGNTTNATTPETNTTAHMYKEVNTSGVVSNIAYFHMLYSFAAAEFENPFECLLKLKFDQIMVAGAKARAAECPPKEERRITISHNMTEFYMVSEMQKHNLTALSRKRLRDNEKEWPYVLPISRVVHAAFYSDQPNTTFDKATMDERPDLGEAMDGYFTFGCDMAECKEDGIKKSIIVCQATREVPPMKRIISKAEYERRFGKPKGEVSSSSVITIFSSLLVSLAILIS